MPRLRDQEVEISDETNAGDARHHKEWPDLISVTKPEFTPHCFFLLATVHIDLRSS